MKKQVKQIDEQTIIDSLSLTLCCMKIAKNFKITEQQLNALLKENNGRVTKTLRGCVLKNTTDNKRLAKAIVEEIKHYFGEPQNKPKNTADEALIINRAETWLKGIIEQPTPSTAQPEIMTDRAKKYFEKAIQAGYMEQAGNGYKWTFRGAKKGAKAALCYFIMKVYSPDISDPKTIHYKALQKLFNVDRLDSGLSAMLNAKKPQGWRGDIDSLFHE